MDYREFRERYQYDSEKDLLGQGGFGRVYRARDVLLNRLVALKVYSRDVPQQYDLISEIRRAIDLNHRNICRYYGAEVLRGTNALGESQTIQVGIMEFIDGGTVDAYLRKNAQARRQLLADVLRGLSYLHQHQPPIIHRDLKPSNVLVGFEDGVPVAKITDFGVSKSASLSGAGVSVVGLGTYGYMAPEQLNPLRYGVGGKIQCNLDLWSFGVMTMELLSGVLPFSAGDLEASTGQILEAINRGVSAEDLHIFDEPYQSMLRLCMVQNAGKRAQSAAELLAILDGAPLVSDGQTRYVAVTAASQKPTPTVFEAAPTLLQSSSDVELDTRPKLQTVVEGSPSPIESIPRTTIDPPRSATEESSAKSRNVPGWAWGAIAVVILSAVSFAAWKYIASRSQSHPTPVTVSPSSSQTGQPTPQPEQGANPRATNAPAVPEQTKPASPERTKSASQPSEMPAQGKAAPIENPIPSTKPNETAVQPQPTPTESPKPPVMGTSSANPEQQAAALNEQGRYTEAIPLYDRACSSGNMIACRQLGMIYSLGHGVPKDEPRAVALVTKACDGNDAEACRLLGDTYFNQNNSKAAELLARGCELGATNSCGDLGVLYNRFSGNSVLLRMDSSRALSLISKGCNAGDLKSCTALGDAYVNGYGVGRDNSRGLALYANACDRGYAVSCLDLGYAYSSGVWIVANMEKARQYFQKACSLGDQRGCTELKEIH